MKQTAESQSTTQLGPIARGGIGFTVRVSRDSTEWIDAARPRRGVRAAPSCGRPEKSNQGRRRGGGGPAN
ncbi:MAG: hypothetical protein K8T90_05235 [Planctomycetes bacterium]|nr:hypothetical protein [Planctomycetota bacterium]